MNTVYTNYFVNKPDSSKVGRKIYEIIMANTDYNLCPYCSQRSVKTLDHFLPKSTFIPLAVVPANLLPCCSDCNKEKLDDIQLTEDKLFIHPYFDAVSFFNWLKCTVVEKNWPITFSYEVSKDISDQNIKSRIEYQFNLLKLNKLYADNATREFNKRVKYFVKEYNSNPENKLLDCINDNIDTYQFDNRNSWQTKMFEALKSSTWFREIALPQLENRYLKREL